MIFLPNIILGLILTSILILVGVLLDMYVQYKEYLEKMKIKDIRLDRTSITEEEKFQIEDRDSIENMDLEGIFF